jgi:hypothetical protein
MLMSREQSGFYRVFVRVAVLRTGDRESVTSAEYIFSNGRYGTWHTYFLKFAAVGKRKVVYRNYAVGDKK